MKNIYDLPTMKPMDVSRVIKNLDKVIIGEKSYEVLSGTGNVVGYRFVFVTGCDEYERDLPVWDHPIIVEDVSKGKVIVTDVRKYLGKVDEKPVFLADVVREKSGLIFSVNRAIIMALVDSGSLGVFKQIQNTTASLFANVINSSVSMYMDLNPREKLLLETVVAFYVHNMFLINHSENDRVAVMKARVLNTKLSLPSLTKKEIDDMILSINNFPTTFRELLENIKMVIPDKKDLFKEEAIYSSLSGLWYGPGAVATSLVHLEDLSTMITLYYSAITDNTYKKTRIANILNNSKRRLDFKTYEDLSLVLAEYHELKY